MAFRPALRSTQPPVQWAPVAISPEIKWLEREADRSPPLSAEVKDGVGIVPRPHKSSRCDAWLIKR